MPYPTNTLKIVWHGATHEDIWNTTLDIAGHASPPIQAELDTFAADVATLFATAWVAALDNLNAVITTYTGATVYSYLAGSSSAALIAESPVLSNVGTNTTTMLPQGVCLRLEKRTNVAGRRERGSMYLPTTGGPLDGTLEFDSGSVGPLADSMQTLFNGVQAELASQVWGAGGMPVVTSVTRTVAPNPITSIRIDTLPDYQRRRKNAASPNVVVVRPV